MMPGTGLERVLLVEGPDDKHVVRQLCRRQSVPDFSIKVAGTVETLLSTVGAEMLAPGRESVGILIDADDNLQGRWDELVEGLSEEGITHSCFTQSCGHNCEHRGWAANRHMGDAGQRVFWRTRRLRSKDDSGRRCGLAEVSSVHKSDTR